MPLQLVVGNPAWYKKEDQNAFLLWKFKPAGAKIFYIKCTYGSTFTSNAWKELFVLKDLKNIRRKDIQLTHEFLNVTAKTPDDHKTVYYFCQFNTLQGKDIHATSQIKRQFGELPQSIYPKKYCL